MIGCMADLVIVLIVALALGSDPQAAAGWALGLVFGWLALRIGFLLAGEAMFQGGSSFSEWRSRRDRKRWAKALEEGDE